jgi:hypothetical protein
MIGKSNVLTIAQEQRARKIHKSAFMHRAQKEFVKSPDGGMLSVPAHQCESRMV